jgi:hypothetical protein
MRIKLIGGLVAALVLAALPAVATAETVTLRNGETEEPLELGAPIKAFSEDFGISDETRSIACTESEMNGILLSNGAEEDEVEIEESRFEGGSGVEAEGESLCSVNGSGGRLDVSITAHSWRGTVDVDPGKPPAVVGKLDITYGTWDREIDPDFPIKVCAYSASIRSEIGKGGTFSLADNKGTTTTVGCVTTIKLTGNFVLTSGGAVILVM